MKILLPVSLVFSFSLLLGVNSANATIVQSALAPNKIGISVQQLMATTASNVALPTSGNRPTEMANASKGIHLGTNTDIFAIGTAFNYSAFWVRYTLDSSSKIEHTPNYTGSEDPITSTNPVSGELWLKYDGANIGNFNGSRIIGDGEVSYYGLLGEINGIYFPSPTQTFSGVIGTLPFACAPEEGSGCIWNPVLNLSFLTFSNGNLLTSATGFDVLFSETKTEGESYYRQYNLAPVPVPAAVWMMASGLIGLIGIARRRK